ncbi:anaphase-promoting complex subunit CDC26-like isoform X2 [Ciona intestinalis]
MLRRKPSKIKLQVEDLQDYLNHCKETNKGKQSHSETITKEFDVNQTFTTIPANPGGIRNTRSRAEVHRRIGYQPQPITPESTSQYNNIH